MKLAYEEGKIYGLEIALELAELQKESRGDLDYLIATLKEKIKELSE